MDSLNVRRGNIDRSNSDRALLTDTAPLDVPIVFSNDDPLQHSETGCYAGLAAYPLRTDPLEPRALHDPLSI